VVSETWETFVKPSSDHGCTLVMCQLPPSLPHSSSCMERPPCVTIRWSPPTPRMTVLIARGSLGANPAFGAAVHVPLSRVNARIDGDGPIRYSVLPSLDNRGRGKTVGDASAYESI